MFHGTLSGFSNLVNVSMHLRFWTGKFAIFLWNWLILSHMARSHQHGLTSLSFVQLKINFLRENASWRWFRSAHIAKTFHDRLCWCSRRFVYIDHRENFHKPANIDVVEFYMKIEKSACSRWWTSVSTDILMLSRRIEVIAYDNIFGC